jgi:hypothetical protein
MEKGVTEVCTLRALALHAVCEQQATLDTGLLQDVLSLLPLGSHRVSTTEFVELSEDADGTRTAEVGAITRTQKIDGRTTELWWFGDVAHRVGGPARQSWDADGQLIFEAWYVRGKMHRQDGPAWRKWNAQGRLLVEEWQVRGCRHREDGPAWQLWDGQGRLLLEAWYVRGELHREGGPAWQAWNSEGRLVKKEWRVRGKRQRHDAEARQDHR